MTINKFIEKWSPIDEPHLKEIFSQDVWSVIDKLGEDRFRQVAIEVLSDIEGAELIIKETNEIGFIIWGKANESAQTGAVVTFPKALGQQSADWLLMLKIIAKQALKNE